MRLTGFRGYNWEADKYWVGIPDGAMLVNNIEAQALNRPGTYPTFGVSIINPMYLTCQVGYNGPLSLEAAFMNFFKRLNPVDITPGQLRAVRNDAVAITINAVLSIPAFSTSGEQGTKDITFVCCEPFWLASGYTTGSGGFA